MRALPLSAIFVLVCCFSVQSPAAAQPANSMAIDMEVSGNSGSHAGSRQDCVEASSGDTVVVDVVATGVPPFVDNPPVGVTGEGDAGGIVSFSYNLYFNNTFISVAEANHDFLVGLNANSSPFNASDLLPGKSPWLGAVLDAGSGVPESGDGVLSRLTLEIDSATPAGRYDLLLQEAAIGGADEFFTPAKIENARIAVNIPCVSTQTAAPTPTDAPITPIPTPTAGPTDQPSNPTPTPGGSTVASSSPTRSPGTPTGSPGPSLSSTPDDSGNGGDHDGSGSSPSALGWVLIALAIIAGIAGVAAIVLRRLGVWPSAR